MRRSSPATERARRLGPRNVTGQRTIWIGVYSDPERAAKLAKTLHSLRVGTERAAEPLDITVMCATVPTTDQVRRYADAGVHRLILAHRLFTTDLDIEITMSNMERFGDDVIATSN